MSLHVYEDLIQGTDEWYEARRGILTASVMHNFITPRTIKPASNDFSRRVTNVLVAERITGWVEDTFQNWAMARGVRDEPLARAKYAETYAPVETVGFIVRENERGHRLGYSPDGLVGDDGLIEIKSRAPQAHLATVLADAVPAENMAQLQTGLYVTGRQWIDYISWCGGMRMWHKRVLPDPAWFEAIEAAWSAFEETAAAAIATYNTAVKGLPETKRIVEEELVI